MRHRVTARRIAAATALSLIATLAVSAVSTQADAASADYTNGYNLGHEAYEYGLPLLDTERVFQTQTSVNTPDGSGDGPVNEFSNLTNLATPTASQQTVVAPNADTLYSIAWLDLSHQPQVIHVPAIPSRFYTLEMLSPWTENFYNISNVSGPASTGAYNLTAGGNFAVVPPGYAGSLPAGVRVIHSPYDRVWVIGRTLLRSQADTPAVNAIQAQYTITPLSAYGHPYTPPAPATPHTTPTFATVPGTQPGQDPLAFYTALDQELSRFAPMAQDAPLLAQLRAIDIGPGLNPATDPHLSADTLAGMRAAVTDGPTNLKNELTQLYLTNSLFHNGYLVIGTGTYGTNYQLRAIVDKIGLGANLPNVAVYPVAQTDRLLQALTGTSNYVLHVPAGQLPPTPEGFWSLTMYDNNGFFVPNALNRYVINDRTNLHKNADGSVDIYVQHTAPTNPTQLQNWLPAPAGGFHLIWRLYGTGTALPGILNGTGWQPPAIQECLLGIGLPFLTACAS